VISFKRQNPLTDITNANTLIFRVTFSEGVTGVNAGAFAVSASTANVNSVNLINSSVYDVVVAGGNLAGFTGTVV
jgi:hypothetical protein